MIKMTLAEICKNPANFMYLFADEERFLKYLDRKSAVIIRAKKRNQQQVLVNAVGADEYQKAIQQVKAAFENVYGMTPQKALVTLANGGEVAGKNWANGVYGVGAVRGTTFSQNGSIKVDPVTGVLYGQDVLIGDENLNKVVGKDKDGNAIYTSYSYTDAAGNTYISQYDKKTGKYYAASYTTTDGVQQNASGGAMTDADNSSVWVSVLGSLQKIIEWIVNLFKGNREAISAKNTMPNQVDDGFVTTESSMSWIWVLLLAGGALLYGMPKVDTGKKKSK